MSQTTPECPTCPMDLVGPGFYRCKKCGFEKRYPLPKRSWYYRMRDRLRATNVVGGYSEPSYPAPRNLEPIRVSAGPGCGGVSALSSLEEESAETQLAIVELAHAMGIDAEARWDNDSCPNNSDIIRELITELKGKTLEGTFSVVMGVEPDRITPGPGFLGREAGGTYMHIPVTGQDGEIIGHVTRILPDGSVEFKIRHDCPEAELIMGKCCPSISIVFAPGDKDTS